MRQHWYKPGFWAWWWRHRLPTEVQASIVILALAGMTLAGFLSAGSLIEPEEDVVYTERKVTVTSTVIVNGKPRLVREVRTVRVPGKRQMITVQRDGQTITVRAPATTLTTVTTLPGKKSIVVKNRTITVPGKERVVTLPGRTLPGTTIVGPERVVTTTGPGSTITAPGETIERNVTQTVTGPTVTQTQTVTGPTQTVTGPTVTVTGPTVTVTQTDTETVTVTVTETTP
jgi:hypothetical protein